MQAIQRQGMTVVCLIPARTDTAYWHNHVMKAKEIRFVKGRLKFERSRKEYEALKERGELKKLNNSATFPSAVVVFDGKDHKAPVCSSMERQT